MKSSKKPNLILTVSKREIMDRLRRMEVFVKVVESEQITLAAKQLSLSKSTVSQALSDLERYLGLQLVKRNSRTMHLTAAGQIYYEDCRRVLDEIDQSEDRVRGESSEVVGLIRLTAPDSFGSYILTPIIGRFMADKPEISVNMLVTERHVDLIAEGIDLAFRVGEMKDSRLLMRKVGTGRMMLCAAPSYLAACCTPTSIEELSQHECLRYIRSPGWTLMEDGKVHTFHPKGRVSTDSGENLREFAIAGRGIGYMPNVIAKEALARGKLVSLMEGHAGQAMDIHLVRPGGRHCPLRIKKLIDFIVADFKSGASHS